MQSGWLATICATIAIWAIRDLAWTDRASRVGQPPPSPATWLVEGIADGTMSGPRTFPVSHVDVFGQRCAENRAQEAGGKPAPARNTFWDVRAASPLYP